eukprot:sb/3478842/
MISLTLSAVRSALQLKVPMRVSRVLDCRVTKTQEPTDTSKQPIRTRDLCHVTGYQPIRDQSFLIVGSLKQLSCHSYIGRAGEGQQPAGSLVRPSFPV